MSDTCKGKVCPHLSKAKEVVCIEHRCVHFQHLLGRQPQTGEVIDSWDCAFNWHNILLIEAAQQTRQAGAAIESFRNEVVKGNQQTLLALLATHRQEQIDNEDYDNPK